ncbi:hypothetical protein KKF81_00435 [Candidatus Micrarchaeota archaeon]|nr:hypothetical protein [Candidatus Micrarchaeota archaeon]
MDETEAFSAAINEAKRLEKKLIEYAPYKGDIKIDVRVELEPEEYLELDYQDLINIYERTQKIVRASGLEIYSATPTASKPEMPDQETIDVETKIKEMTTETLQRAEEISKEPEIELEMSAYPIENDEETIISEQEKQTPQHEPDILDMVEKDLEMEIEKSKEPEVVKSEPTVAETKKQEKSEEIEIEGFALENEPELPIEKPKIAEKPKAIEQPTVRSQQTVVARQPEKPQLPPVLRETPAEETSKRYKQMEEEIRRVVGEKADELVLKKKMLDLTKQLFKEKITSKREEIKTQITVLKNMLVSAKESGTKATKTRKKEKDETHTKLLETIISAQKTELAQTKDEIINAYKKRMQTIKNKFYEERNAEGATPTTRKNAHREFIKSISTLAEQLPTTIPQYAMNLSKKHTAEIENLKQSLDAKDTTTLQMAKNRSNETVGGYEKESNMVKTIIAKEMENMLDNCSDIEQSEGTIKKADNKKENVKEIINEINDTDDGTLLYYLHSKNQEYYKQYERKHISKAEAIFKAKALLAKEKGLDDITVRRYFSQEEV